jgi:hypothetical protein
MLDNALMVVLFVVFVIIAFNEGLTAALLFAIFGVLVVLAIFVQRGLNEIIKGLESLDRRLMRVP